MGKEAIYEVVITLVGPIGAVGSSEIDERRLENMGKLIWVVDSLLTDLAEETRNAERVESSMAVSGKKAKEFLAYVVDEYAAP